MKPKEGYVNPNAKYMKEVSFSIKQKKKFFNDLALELGLLSDADAEKYYFRFVKFILKHCGKDFPLEMPGLGKFYIGTKRGCMVFPGKGKKDFSCVVPSRSVMRFHAFKSVNIKIDDYRKRIEHIPRAMTLNQWKEIKAIKAKEEKKKEEEEAKKRYEENLLYKKDDPVRECYGSSKIGEESGSDGHLDGQ